METYLLTYNPRDWKWRNRVRNIEELLNDGFLEFRWSISQKRNIAVGERVFLTQQGRGLRGIIGSGTVVRRPYLANHWNKQKRGKAWYIGVQWDALRPNTAEGIYSREKLGQGGLSEMHWDARRSGNTIKAPIARELEKRWKAFLKKLPTKKLLNSPSRSHQPNNPNRSSRKTLSPKKGQRTKQSKQVNKAVLSAMEGMRNEVRRFAHKRHRGLVDEAKRRAGGICEACGRNFKKLLDGKGVRVLQAHHREQLSAYDEPKLTRVEDLAVLCANCHSLVHFDPKKPMKVETLRKLIR